jgi:hypothetical protein
VAKAAGVAPVKDEGTARVHRVKANPRVLRAPSVGWNLMAASIVTVNRESPGIPSAVTQA